MPPVSRAACTACLLGALGFSGAAWADDAPREHFGIGLFVGVPGDGSGIPIDAAGAGHLPIGLLGQYCFHEHLAAAFGFGIPVAGEGATVWLGAELSVRILASANNAVAWRVYATPGVQLGFVGPGYFATHSHVFVGWGYIYSGPLAPGLRLPLGTAVALADGRFEMFAEFLPVLLLSPTAHLDLGGAFGFRYYF